MTDPTQNHQSPRPPASLNARQRRWRMSAVAGYLLLVATVPACSGGPGNTGAQATQPSSDLILGIAPKSVEPCSLVDASPLSSYGWSPPYNEMGDYAACFVDIYPPSGGWIRGTVEFRDRFGPNDQLSGVIEDHGDIRVSREPPSPGDCRRTILLPERTPVIVDAMAHGNVQVDMCIVAETMTKTALAKLASSGLGTRPLGPPNSLVNIDMCSLPSPDNLNAAGFDPAAASPGYGRWYCSWRTAAGATLQVSAFRQDPRPEGGTQIVLTGHDTVVLPGDQVGLPNGCVAKITNRRFLTSDGAQRIERIAISYTGLGPETPDALCRMATTFAGGVAARLPSG